MKKLKIIDYWMCQKCANKAGGVFPKGHVCTVTHGQCKYCSTKDVTLIPWVDFDWPKEKVKDSAAKRGRD
jgi:hypothetical protein